MFLISEPDSCWEPTLWLLWSDQHTYCFRYVVYNVMRSSICVTYLQECLKSCYRGCKCGVPTHSHARYTTIPQLCYFSPQFSSLLLKYWHHNNETHFQIHHHLSNSTCLCHLPSLHQGCAPRFASWWNKHKAHLQLNIMITNNMFIFIFTYTCTPHSHTHIHLLHSLHLNWDVINPSLMWRTNTISHATYISLHHYCIVTHRSPQEYI